MINIITDILFPDDYFKKKIEYLNKLKKELHEETNLSETRIDDLINDVIDKINKYDENYFVWGDDVYIFAYSDGEDYQIFINDENWQEREIKKMLHWKLIVSFYISEIYED